MEEKKRVIVVGAGAAGMLAAIAAAGGASGKKTHAEVVVLEKNEKSGKKLYITGKGRCNLTNAAEPEELLGQVIRNPRFLYSSFYGFDNQATMRFFESLGLRLKVERGKRVFPESDKSSDVIKVLNREMERLGVVVRYRAEAARILTEPKKDGEGEQVCGVCLKSGETIKASQVIVATGGLSYPSTGSTGDGYRFAEEAGHQIVPTRPSLVPFSCTEDWVKQLQGLTLKNSKISLWQGEKKCYEEFGELLFTHFGVSGPVILSASSVAGDCLTEAALAKQPVRLTIDLKPALSEEQLEGRLLREIDAGRNKAMKHILEKLLPKSLVPVILKLSGIPPEKKGNILTKEERKALCARLKKLPLRVDGLRGYAEAVITKGGVSVKEIQPKTMESKLLLGLYLAGEVLDVDALTGGFNLQIAWSTGWAAGLACYEKNKGQKIS